MQIKTITTKHTKTRQRIAEGEINCCCHYVEFYYKVGNARITEDDLQRLEEEAEQRATTMIAEGYYQGDLCCLTFTPVRQQERELFGWWSIST